MPVSPGRFHGTRWPIGTDAPSVTFGETVLEVHVALAERKEHGEEPGSLGGGEARL